MNISHDGVTVRFKTEPEELFLAEKSGTKPNTVRIIDTDEYEMLNAHTPKKIIIQYQEEIFLRTLTNLHFAKLFGKVIVIFSWTHEKHQPAHIHSMPYEPGNYKPCAEEVDPDENPSMKQTLSPEEQGSHRYEQTIKISTSLRKKLDSYRYAKMYDTFISELLANYIHTADKQQSIDDTFAAITISKGTLALIQSIAHGRTMNKVIQELYERYRFQRAEERGPLHD
jgi:hypothetical protein